jgi:hypothetical protein
MMLSDLRQGLWFFIVGATIAALMLHACSGVTP